LTGINRAAVLIAINEPALRLRQSGPLSGTAIEHGSAKILERNMQKPGSGASAIASDADITSILGNLDPDKLLAVLSLRPTIAEVEEASMWLSGDADVFGANEPVKGNASHIITILTAEEEEEPRVV